MRNLLYTVLALIGLALYLPTQSQVSIDSVAILTASPTDCSDTEIRVTGQENCANYVFIGDTVTTVGSTIKVTRKYSTGIICLPAIISYTDTLNLGHLPDGTWTLKVCAELSGLITDSASTSITITRCCPVTADFKSNNSKACLGDTLSFTDSSSAAVFSRYWFVNGVLMDSTIDYQFVATNPGTYDVKLLVEDTCGLDSLEESIVVLDKPNLGPDTSICVGESLTLSVDTNWSTILWTGGGTKSSATFSNAGTYTVTTSLASGCTRMDTIVLSQVGTPLALGPDQTYCLNDTVQLDAGPQWTTVNWSTGNSGRYLDVFFSATISASAVDSNGCRYRDTVTISPSAFNLRLFGDDSVCTGDTAFVYIPSSWTNILWSTGQNDTGIFLNNPGSYSVNATSLDSCPYNVAFDIIHVDYPNVNLADTSLCDGDSLSWDVSEAGATYTWDDGSTNPIRSISGSGTYHVTLTKLGKCSSSDTAVVSTLSYPFVDLGPDTTYCIGETVVLNAGNPNLTHSWSNGSSDSSIQVTTTGTYSVEVSHDGDCGTPDTVVITFEDCDTTVGLDPRRLLDFGMFPNPANDVLSVEANGFERYEILDFTGKLVLRGVLEESIDLSSLENGMYLLRLHSASQILQKNFVKRY
jgi:hypothetical protein